MKKVMYLVAVAMTVACSTSKEIPQVQNKCPSRMAGCTPGTMVEKHLEPQDLVGSKASISGDLVLETLSEHFVDSTGTHVFNRNKIRIPTESVGVIERVPEGGSIAEKIALTLYREQQTSNSYAIEIEFERTPYVNIYIDAVSQEDIEGLRVRGGVVDEKGFLRMQGDYIVINKDDEYERVPVEGNMSPDAYVLSLLKVEDRAVLGRFGNLNYGVTPDGYLVYDGRYLIQNIATQEIFFIQSYQVSLNQLKYRECGNVKTINTPGFDDEIE